MRGPGGPVPPFRVPPAPSPLCYGEAQPAREPARKGNMNTNQPLPLANERIAELMNEGHTMLSAMRIQREEAIAWGVANGKLSIKPSRKKV